MAIDEIEQKSQSYLAKLDNYTSSLDDFEDSEDEKQKKPTVPEEKEPKEPQDTESEAVSYTHLTLPTKA